MGRWTQYDEDAYRLPAGMVRTGYDADTGQYTFQDRTGTYKGLPGAEYGPMLPASATAPSLRVAVVATHPPLPSIEPETSTRSQKTKRRATLPNMPSALRSLKRSLTTVRKPWRRDQSPSSDDEEAVMVSRPASVAASPLRSTEKASSAALGRGSVLTAVSLPSSATSKTSRTTEARISKSAAAPASTASRPLNAGTASTARTTKSLPIPSAGSTSPPKEVPPTPPPKEMPPAARTASTTVSPGTKVASPVPVRPYRSASTSAARGAQSEDRSRRPASEHVFAARAPISTRTIARADTTSKNPSSTTAPASPGTANAQTIPSTRQCASERTSSSSASVARSTSTTSPRPRTSTSTHPARSLSSTAEAPRTSRTLAMALAT